MRARCRRLGYILAIGLTITGGILTGVNRPAWGAITLALACTCVFAAWLIGVPVPPPGPQSPPRPYEEWRTELEVARFRGQISAWEATQKGAQQ